MVPPLCEGKRERGSLAGGSVRGRGGCPGSRLRASLAVGLQAQRAACRPASELQQIFSVFG